MIKALLKLTINLKRISQNIYALGDVITSTYRHVNLPAQVPLAWGAHRGASVIAEQLAGKKHNF